MQQHHHHASVRSDNLNRVPLFDSFTVRRNRAGFRAAFLSLTIYFCFYYIEILLFIHLYSVRYTRILYTIIYVLLRNTAAVQYRTRLYTQHYEALCDARKNVRKLLQEGQRRSFSISRRIRFSQYGIIVDTAAHSITREIFFRNPSLNITLYSRPK